MSETRKLEGEKISKTLDKMYSLMPREGLKLNFGYLLESCSCSSLSTD